MWLDVDGRRIDTPEADDIAAGFHSINSKDGWLGRSISMIVIRKDETHYLCAAGHPVEGFSLSLQDGDSLCEFFSNKMLPMADVIRILQTYAA